MTLNDLKSVLDNALAAAYERRDRLKVSSNMNLHYQSEQTIMLLQDLHLGVIRTMEAQAERNKIEYDY